MFYTPRGITPREIAEMTPTDRMALTIARKQYYDEYIMMIRTAIRMELYGIKEE